VLRDKRVVGVFIAFFVRRFIRLQRSTSLRAVSGTGLSGCTTSVGGLLLIALLVYHPHA
jgi:hypothetical protein